MKLNVNVPQDTLEILIQAAENMNAWNQVIALRMNHAMTRSA
jgi:hypothetical protein